MSAPIQVDLCIVGSGPAGMAAACQAAALGLSAVVVDEQAEPGGQIYRGIESASERAGAILGVDYARGRAIVREFRASGIPRIGSATVIGVSADRQVGVDDGTCILLYQCRGLIVATGAIERPFPIPGWTLPGVMAAGGIQVLLKAHALLPQGRIVIAGSGPLAYLVATQLLAAGLSELIFLDTTPRRNYLRAAPALSRALASGRDLVKGLGLLKKILGGVPRYVSGVRALAGVGAGRLHRVRYYAHGRGHEIEADWLLLHQGIIPNGQLLQAAGCEHGWDEDQLCWRPVTDADGETTRPGIFAVGDAGGILGADAAPCSGRLAVLAFAARSGRIEGKRAAELAAPLRKHLQRLRRFRAFVDRLYRPADGSRLPVGDVTVCRCENVSAASLAAAVRDGCRGPNQLKFFTRCGMGPCQGRYCGITVSELLARETGVPLQEIGYFRIRQPIKPVRLATLASAATPVEKSAAYHV
jgi:thioredoxin reductase